MPILNLLPRENMLFGTEGIELYKGGNYIDSHGAYPNGTSYDFTTRISFNASTGHITFQYHDDVSGGATVSKGNFDVSKGSITAGTSGDTAAERQVRVESGAGVLYMYSQAATTGSRGIYAPAHGSGGAKTVIRVDTNNGVTYGSGTVDGTLNVSGNVNINNSQELYINHTVANHTAGYAQIYLRVNDSAKSIQCNGYMRVYSDANGWGSNMVIHTGGSVTIGGGESPQGIYDAIGIANTEECLRLTADGNVYVYVNANAVASRIQHTFYSNGEFHVSDTNLSRKVRDILTRNSGGTAINTNYLITNRL